MLILFIQVSSSLVLPTKSYDPEKTYLILDNRRETRPKSYRILTKITPSDSANERTLIEKFQAPINKNMEFCIFCQKTDRGYVFICLFLFFFSGVIASTQCTRILRVGSF